MVEKSAQERIAHLQDRDRVKKYLPLLDGIEFPPGPERDTARAVEVARRNEVVRRMEPVTAAMLDSGKYLLERARLWQPGEKFNPLTDGAAFYEQMQEASPALLVLVVGNGATESAPETYAGTVSKPSSSNDRTGTDTSAQPRFGRGWLAEEDRHKELFARWNSHNPRLNQRAVEATTTNLIANGFNPRTEDDPYRLRIFGTIQEDLTDIAHTNTGLLARQEESLILADGCSVVATDERRHHNWYNDECKILAHIDPNGFVNALHEMLDKPIVLPAALMTAGESLDPTRRTSELFDKYDIVSEATGMLTGHDFVDSIRRHYDGWNIDNLELDEGGQRLRERIKKRISAYTRLAQDKADAVARMRDNGVILEFPWLLSDIPGQHGVVDLSSVPVLQKTAA